MSLCFLRYFPKKPVGSPADPTSPKSWESARAWVMSLGCFSPYDYSCLLSFYWIFSCVWSEIVFSAGAAGASTGASAWIFGANWERPLSSEAASLFLLCLTAFLINDFKSIFICISVYCWRAEWSSTTSSFSILEAVAVTFFIWSKVDFGFFLNKGFFFLASFAFYASSFFLVSSSCIYSSIF